jgi:hypothetical protein
MSRPRFLADHDLSDHLVKGVLRREPSVSFIRARERGWERLADDELLERAAAEQLAVVSHDANTMTAAAYTRVSNGQPMTGLFIAPQNASIADCIDSVIRAWSTYEADELIDRVLHLPLPHP